MADPFSILGVGLGVASLVLQVTDECIKRYKYFTEASQMAQCYQYLRLRMQIEQQRFLSFATKAAHLSKDGETCSALQVDKSLLIAVLLEVRTVFEKLEEGEAKYGDIVQQRGVDWGDEDEPQTDLMDMLRLPCRKPVFKNSQHEHNLRGFRKVRNRIFKTARKIKIVLEDPRRLVWVSVDREVFEALISKLSDLNSFLTALMNTSETRALIQIAETTKWEILKLRGSVADLDILVRMMSRKDMGHMTYDELSTTKGRCLVDSPLNMPDYEEKWSFRSKESWKLRQTDTNLLDEQVIHSSVNQPTTMMLDLSEFSFTHNGLHKDCHARRMVASWEEHSVWIEWMDFIICTATPGTETSQETRVSLITGTLRKDASVNFRSPRCLGYVKSIEGTAGPKFGMVFEPPTRVNTEPELITLRQLFKIWPKPSLSSRISLSSALADSIANFHSADWLHKGLKSDNILFFGNQTRDFSLRMPYISGFDLSRPCNNEEMTEPFVFDPWSDIYRHPNAQFGEARNSYRKSYDMYSFGVILMEIAMWKPIEDILGIENLSEIKQYELRGIYNQLLGQTAQVGDMKPRSSAHLENIANECGDAFREVVELCLDANNVERPAYRGEPKSAINSRMRIMFAHVTERLRMMKDALGGI